jgi:PDDEXK-like domain of unknown function (DUF3799)
MNAPMEIPLGIRYGIPIDKYHGGPGISKSGLDEVNQSPWIYFSRHLDPNRPKEAGQTAAQLAGNLAHCAILEPDEFDKRYIVGPDVNKNTNVWKAFVAENADKTVIDQKQRDIAKGQAKSVLRIPDVARGLSKGQAEVSAYWIDPDTGVLCRCRPDWVSPVDDAGVILWDVKTYSDASTGDFARQIARMRYHVQDAFYSDGYGRAAGLEVYGFVFVAVEDKWPFAANAIMINETSEEQGRRQYRRDLNTYAACLKSGLWPGYAETIQMVDLPNWAFDKGEHA